MEIKKLTLNNIGRFDQLDVLLAPLGNSENNVTVFVGNNGSGKTSILKSLATSLSWLIARIKSEKGNGTPIPELVIKNGKTSGSVDIDVYHSSENQYEPDIEGYSSDNNFFTWRLAKSKQGRKGDFKSDYFGATLLADQYRSQLSRNEKASLPLIAFYSVERVVIDIPLKIKYKHTSFQLDGYDKSLSQGIDFRRFFEWFREREDAENESGFPDETLERLQLILDRDSLDKIKALKKLSKDKQLSAVRSAIHQFMPEFSNLRIRRKPRLHMSIDKDGETLNVSQLSQGEKSLMALIGDIARRLAIMNPDLEDPLRGDGIVLIDEIDMHLHPKWQRSLLNQLIATFPKCQFVITTHSPLVISDCKNILTYLVDETGLTELRPLYGEDANTVLLEIMDTNVRNPDINNKLNNVLDAIHDSKIDVAKKLVQALEEELPSGNMELAKAKLLLRKKELQIAKNN